MSFAPKYPEIMPVTFVQAIKRFHGQRDRETRGSFSRLRIKAEEANVTSKRSPFEIEEATLTSISESVEVATSIAKLEKAVSPPAEFWEQLINVSVGAREKIRTADKRTNSDKIKKCEEIRKSLEQTSKLIASEAFGTLSPGIESEKLYDYRRPFDQLLLGDIATKPVRISLAKNDTDNDDLDFRSSTGSVWSGSVSNLCDALSESIEDLIGEIKNADNEFRDMGYFPRRYVEASLGSIFEATYPDIKTKKFTDARAQIVVALAIAILDLRENKEVLADKFSDYRKARLGKKNI